MKPEVRRYLEEHGETYTPDALRRGLLQAGHDPEEVDVALREWETERSSPPVTDERRRAFGRWAVGLHVAALLLVTIWLLIRGDIGTFAGLAVFILALALLIGWRASAALGRRVLVGTGLGVAVIVPAVSALLIGGSCFALLGGLTGA